MCLFSTTILIGSKELKKNIEEKKWSIRFSLNGTIVWLISFFFSFKKYNKLANLLIDTIAIKIGSKEMKDNIKKKKT